MGFGALGAGVHVCSVYEEEWTKDTTRIMVRDNYLERSTVVTWSISAGAGLEWPLAVGEGYLSSISSGFGSR